MIISRVSGLFSTFFSAAGHSKLSVEYIGGFGLMRHQVGHALD